MTIDGPVKPRNPPQTPARPGRTPTTELPAVNSEYIEDEHTDVRGTRWDNRTALELPAGVKARVTILRGPDGVGVTYPLVRAYNSIGRRRNNEIALSQAAVSSRHAALYFTVAREWRIMDLQSTNGTLLNGARVREFAVRDGDKVTVGDYLLEFREG
jgi:pSer/pThr/pTyr-binding forkhead associated (FHA) protein